MLQRPTFESVNDKTAYDVYCGTQPLRFSLEDGTECIRFIDMVIKYQDEKLWYTFYNKEYQIGPEWEELTESVMAFPYKKARSMLNIDARELVKRTQADIERRRAEAEANPPEI